jgi:hypothetical protein
MDSSCDRQLPRHFLQRFRPRIFGYLSANMKMRCRPRQRDPSAILAVSLFLQQMCIKSMIAAILSCVYEAALISVVAMREDVWQFRPPCNAALRRGKFPKLSAKNFINVTMCQRYPSALGGLTAIEECFNLNHSALHRMIKSGRLAGINKTTPQRTRTTYAKLANIDRHGDGDKDNVLTKWIRSENGREFISKVMQPQMES